MKVNKEKHGTVSFNNVSCFSYWEKRVHFGLYQNHKINCGYSSLCSKSKSMDLLCNLHFSS